MSLQNIINYDNGANFTYDTAKIDFAVTPGKAKLKLLTYTNEVFNASFSTSIDAERSAGSGTGAPSGAVNLTTPGEVDLNSNYIDYPVASNFDFTQTFTVVVGFKPSWTGAAPSTQTLWAIAVAPSNNQNLVKVQITGTTALIQIYNSAGGLIGTTSGTFSGVAGQEAVIAAQVDITTGASKLFLNAVQLGSTIAATGTRTNTATIARLGNNNDANNAPLFDVTFFRAFNAVVDVSTFVPGFDAPSYDKSSPSMLVNSGIDMDGLDGFVETSDPKTGADEIYYTIVINNQDKYWDGAAWSNSDGATQFNTAVEIQTNKASLDISSGATVKVRAFLKSDTGYSTPALSYVTVDYNFYESPIADINETIITLQADDFIQGVDLSTLDGKLVISHTSGFIHSDKLFLPFERSFPFNSQNQVDASVVETTSINVKYSFKVQYTENGITKTVNFVDALVPDTVSVKLTDITTLEV